MKNLNNFVTQQLSKLEMIVISGGHDYELFDRNSSLVCMFSAKSDEDANAYAATYGKGAYASRYNTRIDWFN